MYREKAIVRYKVKENVDAMIACWSGLYQCFTVIVYEGLCNVSFTFPSPFHHPFLEALPLKVLSQGKILHEVDVDDWSLFCCLLLVQNCYIGVILKNM